MALFSVYRRIASYTYPMLLETIESFGAKQSAPGMEVDNCYKDRVNVYLSCKASTLRVFCC